MCDEPVGYRKRNRYETGRADKAQNIYYGPSFDSDVIGIVRSGEEFDIDNNESRGQFLKVYTASGLEGFIRKKAVKIVG